MSSDLSKRAFPLNPESSTKPNLKPQSWALANATDLAQIQGVCLDIDDTLSTQGKLTAEAYASLWNLKKSGFAVIAITGRPAGWCDHFARFWPVDAVVGENGAFTFFMEKGVRKRIDTPQSGDGKKQLVSLGEKIRNEFPHARWASDQAYREFDLAVDICEDVPAWPTQDVTRLLELCRTNGAHAKVSSIHVNIWFGEYDKRIGFEFWLAQGAPGWGISPSLNPDRCLYIGDSPNDEPMFASFKYSVGVANLNRYLDHIKSFPTWITSQESGAGFAEMANRLTQLKK